MVTFWCLWNTHSTVMHSYNQIHWFLITILDKIFQFPTCSWMSVVRCSRTYCCTIGRFIWPVDQPKSYFMRSLSIITLIDDYQSIIFYEWYSYKTHQFMWKVDFCSFGIHFLILLTFNFCKLDSSFYSHVHQRYLIYFVLPMSHKINSHNAPKYIPKYGK